MSNLIFTWFCWNITRIGASHNSTTIIGDSQAWLIGILRQADGNLRSIGVHDGVVEGFLNDAENGHALDWRSIIWNSVLCRAENGVRHATTSRSNIIRMGKLTGC
jgi:hypothetical protein